MKNQAILNAALPTNYTSRVLANAVYVPLVRQAYDYSCGAASLASCLYYWGVWDGREPELYELLNTNYEGTSGAGIMAGAEYYGLLATSRSNLNLTDLRSYLAEGYTVILSIQSWGDWEAGVDMGTIWDDGHYVVLVGIDGDLVYLMDPSVAGEYRLLTVEELMACWHDYNDAGGYDYYGAIILRGDKVATALRPISIK